MKTFVTFQHPAKFVAVYEDNNILSVKGADWFISVLRAIKDIEVDSRLCQEDWGVVVFVSRRKKKFWIGLSDGGLGKDQPPSWMAHVHQGSFAWLQWFSSSGKQEFKQLVLDFHQALSSSASVSKIAWHTQKDLMLGAGAPTPK